MIRTKDIKLTKRELFNVYARRYLRNFGWYWLALLTIGSSFAISKPDVENLGVLALLVFLIVLQLFYYWRFAYSKQNKIFLLKRYYEFDDEKLVAFMEDGSDSIIKLNHFVKVYKNEKYILLFLSKTSFIYLPKIGFERESDYYEILGMVENGIKRGIQ